MSYFASTPLPLFFKETILFCVSTILLIASAAHADPLFLLHKSVESIEPVEIRRVQPPKMVSAGLNNKGLLGFQFGETTLSITYSPDDDFRIQQPNNKLSAHQETPPISGISLALSFSF